jgi:hypothetical protein
MKTDLLLNSLFTMLLFSIVVEGAVSAIFSITAMRMIETKRTVQTSREAVTFLLAAFLAFYVEPLRLFQSAGVSFPMIGDIIVSAMVLMRMTGFIRDLLGKVRQS